MKRVKMVLYGAPGTGKSVFASKSDKPFFICTDGNYEWLEDWGAKEEDHVNVTSWAEIKDLINNPKKFDNYETIVVDLLEDAFKWCEQEYCIRNKIEHVSDQGYGKGWDSSRNEFFLEICKLFAMDKNIILIMHGETFVEKDRRGVEHTKYGPSTRIPAKVVDMIEGRVRYFLRCYVIDEEMEDGALVKKRYLSIVTKPNEFGICRGIDENKIPQDISLEWSEFAKVIGIEKPTKSRVKRESKVEESTHSVEPTIEEIKTETSSLPVEEDSPFEQITLDIPAKVEDKKEEKIKTKEETKEEEVKPEVKEEVKQEPVKSNADKLAAIKAKLAALKK